MENLEKELILKKVRESYLDSNNFRLRKNDIELG